MPTEMILPDADAAPSALIAAGDAGGRAAVGETLRQAGIEVNEAADAGTALARAAESDVLILEAGLPDMGGLRLTSALRAARATAAAAILVWAADGEGSDPAAT
ncbi:MAG TPA: response regulator, partial [Solirubrobacteraceae bacterium]